MMDKMPYRVTVPDGKVRLLVMNTTDRLPATFALMATAAQYKVALRLAGGCKGMTPQDKEEMIAFFSEAFHGYQGLVWSGGTRQVSNGMVDPMITDIPGIIASQNPGCVALGTCPRTSILTLQDDSRLVLDQYGIVPNPDTYGILIVQNGPDGEGGWDLDVPVYFAMMEQLRTYGGFRTLGLISWNGGEITELEILLSAQRGWPTILIEGSGRATDKLAAQFKNHDPNLVVQFKRDEKILIVERAKPEQLRQALIKHGFFKNLTSIL